MKLFLIIISILYTSVCFSNTGKCGRPDNITARDGFPWPWSDQCEFDWKGVEGMWSTGVESYYVIQMGDVNEDFDHDVVVKQYSNQGQMLSMGVGVYREGHKELRVPMISQNEFDGISGFWMQLSWVADHNFEVNDQKKKSCRNSKNRYLAVKTRDFYSGMEDSKAPTIFKKMTRAR